MRYNNALAVGLSIGLPSALVFIGCIVLWLRNRRRQKHEDQSEQDLDVELRDENSFTKFEDALHNKKESKVYNQEEKHRFSSVDVATASSRFSSSSNTFGNDQHKKDQVYSPPASVSVADSNQKRCASAYDFYDTFIPVLPSTYDSSATLANSTPGSPGNSKGLNPGNSIPESCPIERPPPIHTANGSFSHSNSDSSLIDSNHNGSNKSLDNFAKQLLGPLFFEKLPSRAATMSLKQRPFVDHSHTNNSSSDFVPDILQNSNLVNENYVYSDKQKHPYFDRISSNQNTSTTTPAAAGHSIEGNFDNNIAQNADFGDPANVVFK